MYSPVIDNDEVLVGRVLGDGLSQRFGRHVEITRIDRETLPEQSTYPIERLRVSFDGGKVLPVIFKRIHPNPQTTAGLELPKGNRRELSIYRRVLNGGRFGAPELYASLCDTASGRYWLFLEDVGVETLGEADVEGWLTASRWLAELHAAYWDDAPSLNAFGCLTRRDARFYADVLEAARGNVARGYPAATGRLETLTHGFHRTIDVLLRAPRALVHGDIMTCNLMVQSGRVRPIDWESAAIGAASDDLALLLAGWEDVAPLLDAYRDELRRRGVRLESHALERVLAHSDIVRQLWFLGWSSEQCENHSLVDELLDGLASAVERTQVVPA